MTNYSIPDLANLDDYKSPGNYLQSSTARASNGTNYPEPTAGFLEVVSSASTWVLQRYTTYLGERVYTRRLQAGAWTSWSGLASPQPYGKIAKTNGFQALSTSGTAVTMALDFAGHGVTFDSANGGGLKVPFSGVYQISVKGYLTGSSAWLGTVTLVCWRSGVALDLTATIVRKYDGSDYTASETTLESLNANDIITIKMGTSTGSGSTWGDSDKRGTHMSLTKVA